MCNWMHRYYGTFLIYLVEESLGQATTPLSIREIAGGIAQLDSQREQYNLQERVRRALEILEDEGKVLKEMYPVSTHIHCFKYQINQHAQRPEFS